MDNPQIRRTIEEQAVTIDNLRESKKRAVETIAHCLCIFYYITHTQICHNTK